MDIIFLQSATFCWRARSELLLGFYSFISESCLHLGVWKRRWQRQLLDSMFMCIYLASSFTYVMSCHNGRFSIPGLQILWCGLQLNISSGSLQNPHPPSSDKDCSSPGQILRVQNLFLKAQALQQFLSILFSVIYFYLIEEWFLFPTRNLSKTWN